jgi:hypothetical protein
VAIAIDERDCDFRARSSHPLLEILEKLGARDCVSPVFIVQRKRVQLQRPTIGGANMEGDPS